MRKIYLKKMKGKKGTSEALMGLWFFFILAIIGVSVIVVVWMLFGYHKDIRFQESESIYSRLVIGVSDDGYLNEELLSEESDIFILSGLNKDLFYRGGDLYFKIEIIKGNETINKITHGNNDIEVGCGLSGRNLAVCKQGKIKLLRRSNPDEIYIVKIIAGSNQEGEKA